MKKAKDMSTKKSRQQSIKDFTIFKDKKENDKSTVYSSTPEKSKAKKKFLETKAVQCSPVRKIANDVVDLESAEPNDAYWKAIAEERAKALNDTLEENKSLCEIMEVRQQELEELAVENAELTEENRLLADKAASLCHFEKIIAELTNEIDS